MGDPTPNTLGVSEEDLDLAQAVAAGGDEEEEVVPDADDDEDADADDDSSSEEDRAGTTRTTTTTQTRTRTEGKDTTVAGFKYGKRLTWLYYIGMPLLEPQDVSGFDIDRVWTVDRIWSMHRFQMDVVTNQLRADLNGEDWV